MEGVRAGPAVVSAFHGGAELVAHIKKKHRRRSSKTQTQQDFEEKQLQDSLETGETQVTQRFTSDVKELGEIVRVGDGVSPTSIPEIRELGPGLTRSYSHRTRPLTPHCYCYASGNNQEPPNCCQI